jgi:RNA polymerase sigma factor (sigma-70 family)
MPPPPAELFASRIFLGPALRVQPDGRLVGLVREGYDSAFEEIVRRYGRPLERFAAAIVGGRSEDVTQDAFSKALLALRRSEAEIELRPWLYRIVRNTALNDLRDRGPVSEQLSEALAGGASAAAEVERREELSDLMKRLGALPEPQRAAIVMRELEGLSHEEIASALGVSGGAARQAIYRARAALREGLGLVVPMPVLRGLIEHGGDAARGGSAIAAGAGASTAGGALGGLGAGSALKLGAATLLVAGTVGVGVAIEGHRGASQPEAAIAAPLDSGAGGASSREGATAGADASSGRGADSQGHGGGHGGDTESTSGPDRGLSSGTGTRSGSGGSSGGSGDSGGSGGHHGGTGSGDSGGSEGSGPSGGGDDHGGLDGASSDDNGGGGSGSDNGISGTSGGDGVGGLDDGATSGSGVDSGSGGGETTTQTEPVAEGTSGESGSGSSGDGSGDLSGGDTTTLNESP